MSRFAFRRAVRSAAKQDLVSIASWLKSLNSENNIMKSLIIIFLIVIQIVGCGADKELLMETKFDASLKQKISSIGENDPPQMLTVIGKCDSTVDAIMRQDLIDAGAEVVLMQGDVFTANVSSQDVFKVAALEFVCSRRRPLSLRARWFSPSRGARWACSCRRRTARTRTTASSPPPARRRARGSIMTLHDCPPPVPSTVSSFGR